MNVFSLSLALLTGIAIGPAFALSTAQPTDNLPIVYDLPRLQGHAFAVLNHASSAEPHEVEKGDETQRLTVMRLFWPFSTLDIGGTTVHTPFDAPFDSTAPIPRLSDLARLWGNTQAHGEGEVMFSAACWDSRPAGLRVIMTSSLNPYQSINGWVIARDNTPAAQTCAVTEKLTPPTMPLGLQLGAKRATVLRALALPPTTENARQLTWAYTVLLPNDSEISYLLDAWFTDGELSALRYSTLHTF